MVGGEVTGGYQWRPILRVNKLSIFYGSYHEQSFNSVGGVSLGHPIVFLDQLDSSLHKKNLIYEHPKKAKHLLRAHNGVASL